MKKPSNNERIVIMLLLILALSCNYTNPNVTLSWEVKLAKQDDKYNKYKLLCKLHSSDFDTVITIDYKAFGQSCPENDMTRIGSVIIENKDGQIRNFSKHYADENEQKELWDDNCMYAWIDSFYLQPGVPATFDIFVPYLSDLKVTSKDTQIRLHYFNHRFPDDIRSVDWKINHLTSNWVRISR